MARKPVPAFVEAGEPSTSPTACSPYTKPSCCVLCTCNTGHRGERAHMSHDDARFVSAGHQEQLSTQQQPRLPPAQRQPHPPAAASPAPAVSVPQRTSACRWEGREEACRQPPQQDAPLRALQLHLPSTGLQAGGQGTPAEHKPGREVNSRACAAGMPGGMLSDRATDRPHFLAAQAGLQAPRRVRKRRLEGAARCPSREGNKNSAMETASGAAANGTTAATHLAAAPCSTTPPLRGPAAARTPRAWGPAQARVRQQQHGSVVQHDDNGRSSCRQATTMQQVPVQRPCTRCAALAARRALTSRVGVAMHRLPSLGAPSPTHT